MELHDIWAPDPVEKRHQENKLFKGLDENIFNT